MVIDPIPQSQKTLDRRAVAVDLWPRRFIERREGIAPVLPARVYWPETHQQVVDLLRHAHDHALKIVPFGAGSGVCAGIAPDEETLVLDTKRLRDLTVDAEALECEVGAGMIGECLERQLNARGFTLGHFPSSIYCSTVGGWVAARSAGQLSSRFGKIEDLLLGFEAVDGTGQSINAHIDDPSTGHAALRIFVGSEGSLCVFTKLRFRIQPLASHRWLRGFTLPSLEDGVSAVQSLMQSGVALSVLRLYDPLDTLVGGGLPDASAGTDIGVRDGPISSSCLEHSGAQATPELKDRIARELERFAVFQHPRRSKRMVNAVLGRPRFANRTLKKFLGGTKLIVGIEGSQTHTTQNAHGVLARLLAAGATDAGSAPGAKWLLHRHRVSYKMSRAFAAGAWVDTMEVATGYENVVALYEDVRAALWNDAVVMCHFSHAYMHGCSLYFTFIGGGGAGTGKHSGLARYDRTWSRALDIVAKSGATISHHHGIGRSKVTALQKSAGGLGVTRSLKQFFDPKNILNRGVLLEAAS